MRGIGGKILTLCLLCMMILTGCTGNNQMVTSIEVWHYYDGAQKIAFDKLVTEFNQTEGMGKGIVVEAFNQGNSHDLKDKIVSAKYHQKDASDLPDICSGQIDMVEELDRLEIIADLEPYVKKSELKIYDDPFIEEGYIGNVKKFKMFPVGKSTEVMMINKTDWEPFAYETGVELKELETWEGLAKVAERYYNWTNSKTLDLNDGKAFFARDNIANYMLVGAKQLGQEIIQIENNFGEINIDNQTMRMLWENFYIPYVNGYYGPFEEFASSDMKTGQVIAYIGATDQATYFPKDITIKGETTHKIEPLILPIPNFANTEPCASLQGAGMAVLKSDEAHERAAVEFLKWFVKPDNNMKFSLETGYLPIAQSLGNTKAIETRLKNGEEKIPKVVEKVLPVAAKQVEHYGLHIQESFHRSDAARDVLAATLLSRAKVDKIKVQDLMDQGLAKEEAVAAIATDTNFQQWVVRLKMEVKGVVKDKNYSN